MKWKSTAFASTAIVAAAVPIAMTVSAQADEPLPAALAGQFYSDPASTAHGWLADHPDSPNAAAIRTGIAEQAGARWYGDWQADTPVDQYVSQAAAVDQTPILVAYNMYDRDCGGESDGGAASAQAYRDWITDFADGVGDRAAIVILEPDAIAQLIQGCVGEPDVRRELLAYAVDQFADQPSALVYLDAGNAEWPADPAQVAGELTDAGVSDIRGFALNTSNHYTTADSDARAADIEAALGIDSHYVVDTSRNGSGKTQTGEDSWCNPQGATLGQHSTSTPDAAADAQLWIKVPGDSDGSCGYGAGIPAGQFSEKLAMALITGQY
jgi:endoglucanase